MPVSGKHLCNGKPVEMFQRVRAATGSELAHYQPGTIGTPDFRMEGRIVALKGDVCCGVLVALGDVRAMGGPSNGSWDPEVGAYRAGVGFFYAEGGFISMDPQYLMPVEV